jgi:galactokinase/mevalonate kinase-like predicted kinase
VTIRFVLGFSALVVGLLAANLALFNWVERTDIRYLLGEYARYVCAYGGFACMILGSMLVNAFAVNAVRRRRYETFTVRGRLQRRSRDLGTGRFTKKPV